MSRRLTLSDLLNNDPPPRTPSPARVARYDPVVDARASQPSASPSVPYRFLTGPGYSPSMASASVPAPAPFGALDALVEAATSEQRRLSTDALGKRKREPPDLAEKEREVLALMAAHRAASRSPEQPVPFAHRPRRPWEDPPSPSPAGWRPPSQSPVLAAPKPTPSPAALPPPSPAPPPPPPAQRSPDMPSFSKPSWGARPALQKIAPAATPKPRPKPAKRAPLPPPPPPPPPSASMPEMPVAVAPSAIPASVSAPAQMPLDTMPSIRAATPPLPPEPAAPEPPADIKHEAYDEPMRVDDEPAPLPPQTPTPPPSHLRTPSPPKRSASPALAPVPLTLAVPALPAPSEPSPAPATPLDADEELARSLDAQLNRRARPGRARAPPRTEKQPQPDLDALLAAAERERPAPAPSKNRARDRKKAEEAARKRASEAGEAGGSALDDELLSLVGEAGRGGKERESMPPPAAPSPDEERAPARNKKGKQPAARKSTGTTARSNAGPSARSRSASAMPSSALAHELKFDSGSEDTPAPASSAAREAEPEDALARAWAAREEQERARRADKEKERGARRRGRGADKDLKGAEGAADKDKERGDDDRLYCVCAKPYDPDTVMIACDRCDEWYHPSCVSMADAEVDLVDTFICPPCIAKDPALHLRTTYKARCARAPDCARPARGALSKYCGDACGVLAARARIGAWGGDRSALWAGVRAAPRREGVVVRADADGPVAPGQGTHAHAARTLARLRAQLVAVVAQREAVERARESVEWRARLLALAGARAEADAREACGWDQRLCFGAEEIAEFGAGVFESYEAAPGEPADGDEDGDEAQWWCAGRRKCDRHAGWQKLRLAEVEFERDLKAQALGKLADRERAIRRRVEDIVDPRGAVPALEHELEPQPEPVVNGHGGAARVNGNGDGAKRSRKA